MTPPKTLSPQEALRALADGEKLRRDSWRPDSYLCLKQDKLIDEKGREYNAELTESLNGFEIYTEPKPKRKVAPYYVEYSNDSIVLEVKCFETDDQARKYFETQAVTRCTALEIEV